VKDFTDIYFILFFIFNINYDNRGRNIFKGFRVRSKSRVYEY
jgi:hypothetical protein